MNPGTLNRKVSSSAQHFDGSDGRAESVRSTAHVGYVGKHIVRVSADQTDRADDYGEYYGQHYGVLRNVLTFLARPKGYPP